MSYVLSCMIVLDSCYDIDDKEIVIRPVERFLREHSQAPGEWVDHHFGGRKGSQIAVYGMGSNYLDPLEFVGFLRTLDWQDNTVQFVWNDENDEGVQLASIAGEEPRGASIPTNCSGCGKAFGRIEPFKVSPIMGDGIRYSWCVACESKRKEHDQE